EIDEVFRHVDQVGQAVDSVPEDGAYRSALPQQEEEKQHGQHPEPAGEDAQFDREPGRDDSETVKRRNRNQVQHHRGDLQEDEEGKRRPEVEVAEGRRAAEHQERPSDQHRKQKVAEWTGSGGETAPAIVAPAGMAKAGLTRAAPSSAGSGRLRRLLLTEPGVVRYWRSA